MPGVTLSSCLCLLQHLHEGEDLCVAYKQGLGGIDGLSLIGAGLEQLHCAITYETLMVNLSLEVLYSPILLEVCVWGSGWEEQKVYKLLWRCKDTVSNKQPVEPHSYSLQ